MTFSKRFFCAFDGKAALEQESRFGDFASAPQRKFGRSNRSPCEAFIKPIVSPPREVVSSGIPQDS